MNRLSPLARLALSLSLCLSASGCMVESSWVRADKSTHDVIAPEYRRYLAADETLTPAKRARRERLVDAWGARVEEASK